MNRMWMLAALPLVLLSGVAYGLWASPGWANTISPITCALLLGATVVTGLCVLGYVFTGWMRGVFPLTRGDILAATAFASLDVLVPTTLVVLIWMLVRSLKHGGGLIIL